MRQFQALSLVLLVIFCPVPTRAASECEVIDTLARLQVAVSSRDIEALRSLVRRSDTNGILWTLRDHPLASTSADIGRLIDLGQQIATQQIAPDRVEQVLDAPSHRVLLQHLGRQIDVHVCRNQTEISASSGAPGDHAAPTTPPKPGQPGWRPVRLAGIGIAAVGGMLGFGLLSYLLLRAHGRRSRLSRRFAVSLPARIGGAFGETEARLLDISRQGTKLRIDPEYQARPNNRVTLAFAQLQVEGSIRWRNAHYLGVEFTQPLARDVFANLLVIARHDP